MPAQSDQVPVDVEQLSAALERVVQQCDVQARLELDPVGVVRRYEDPLEQEIVGLLAASLAFGNVKALRQSIENVLERLGPRVLSVLDDEAGTKRRLRGVGHRMVRDVDIARLLVGARRMQRAHKSLGARFAQQWRRHRTLQDTLEAWVQQLREEAGLQPDQERRGPQHVLPSPAAGSACKRLMLYLRWMVRADDGIDLGCWRAVGPSVLLVPLDTHVHRLARNLGMTGRTQASWAAAEDITSVLRRIDPHDPVRFDFALCHLGMSQRCTAGAQESSCAACTIGPLCRQRSAGRLAG